MTTYTVTVPAAPRSSMWLAALLDMLRYDNATVKAWDKDGEMMTITLQAKRPTFERWQSFGIYPIIKDITR